MTSIAMGRAGIYACGGGSSVHYDSLERTTTVSWATLRHQNLSVSSF